mgnify:CR=1 FL=1
MGANTSSAITASTRVAKGATAKARLADVLTREHIDTVRRTAAEKKNKNIGYNVLTGKYVDMIEAGVIDPVKVVRGALENAASIASMILTTDVLITDMPEKDKAPAMPPGGMGGMDY